MANKIYTAYETATVWTDSTGDLAMTLQNLAASAGRQGATLDRGTASKPGWFLWTFETQFETTPVVDEIVQLFLKVSQDDTVFTNDDGEGDIALSATNKTKNLIPLRSLIVDKAAADVTMMVSDIIFLPWRSIVPVVYNGTADNLQNTANVNKFTLYPIPPEIQ